MHYFTVSTDFRFTSFRSEVKLSWDSETVHLVHVITIEGVKEYTYVVE
jgi:hypothetical protein